MLYTGTIIEELYTEAGAEVYTVLSTTGHVFTPCFKMGLGGFPQVFMSAPYGIGAEVAIAPIDDNIEGPFFIVGGITAVEDLSAMNLASSTPATFVNGVEYKTFSNEDMCWRNGSSAVNLVGGDSQGVAVSGNSINMQLRGGLFAVSNNGVSANQLLNAAATIETLVSYIAQLNLKIQQLELAHTQHAAITASIATATGVAPTVADQAGQLASTLSVLSALPLSSAVSVSLDLNSGINPSVTVP